MTRLARRIGLASMLALGSVFAAHAALLARGGKAKAVIVVSAEAIPSETTAAAELALYLGKITGARFEVRPESDRRPRGAALYVGPTRLAASLGFQASTFGPEEWVVRSSKDGVVLAGGRPRGTLYAVYHFLEDELGVRWWNAYEESVPRRPTLSLGEFQRRGHPAFAQRDVHGADGRAEFLVRNRVNGANSRISWSYGGYEGFATPWYVHSFWLAVPPEDYFDAHPEYFSERDGIRSVEDTQLCLTNPELPALVASKLSAFAADAEASSRESGAPPQRFLDFSQNDWGGRCKCSVCSAAAEKEKSESGPLLTLLNDVAGRVAVDHPDALLTTLAYTYTSPPPATLHASDHVVVRLSGYGRRDFSKGVLAPENATFRKLVEDWHQAAPRLWIWDYGVIFLEGDRNLPIPSYRYYADDLRFYRDHGVSGILVQHEFPIAADLRDLKVWLYVKLMEDPSRDLRALIRDFTDGYYGKAGDAIRGYLAFLEATADRKPGRIDALSDANVFTYVDADFVVEAERAFDRAEAAVLDDPEKLRRVRHARLTVDFALLRLGPTADFSAAAQRLGVPPPDRRAVADRYRKTWDDQIELRGDPAEKEPLREGSDAEAVRLLLGTEF